MRIEGLSILYVSKSLRSFYNGLFSCFLVYFFVMCIYYKQPIRISLVIFGGLLSNLVKQTFIRYLVKEKKMVYLGMLLTYGFHLIPFLVISHFFLFFQYYPAPPLIMTIVAFFPVDGEQVLLFQQAQLNHFSTTFKDRRRVYNILGYLFQASGSLAFFVFILYGLKEANYEQFLKIKQIYIFLSFFAFLNLAFYTIISFEAEEKTVSDESRQQSVKRQHFYEDNKYSYFFNGLALGLMPAPFLAYYLDLKISLYYDDLGIIVCLFFLLKGIGRDLMQKMWRYKRLFTYWHLVSNISLAIIAIFPDRTITLFSLILSFPVWNYCGVILQRSLDSFDGNQKQVNYLGQRLNYWQRYGTAFGCLISSFSFCLFYEKLYFGYALLLCAVARYSCNKFIQKKQKKAMISENNTSNNLAVSKGDSDNQVQLQGMFQQKIKDGQEEIQKEVFPEGQEYNSQLAKRQRMKKYSLWMILILVFVYYLNLYSTTCIYQGTCYQQRYKADPAHISKHLKLFNESLAHYLVRQGIREVQLVSCDQSCLREYQERGGYYSQINMQSSNPKWLHFAETPYFLSNRQIAKYLASVLLQHPEIVGFSLMWDNPLRYNKMTKDVLKSIIDFARQHGLHYAEMPSLNLILQQSKPLSIFTRQERKPVESPSSVKRQPPKNYLAMVLIFKMATNQRFLRESILYYLNAGVDKFFLFDNDRQFGSVDFYKDYRGVGEYYGQCQSIPSFDAEQAFFHEIQQQFYDHIIYIPWRIGDRYAQGQAYFTYPLFFRTVTKFTFYNDMDEFVHSPSGLYLPHTLQSLLENDEVTVVFLVSRNFRSRVCLGKQLVIEQFEWVRQSEEQLTVKCITLNRINVDENTHGRSGKNGQVAYMNDTRHDFGIWHYKITSTYQELTEDKQQYQHDDTMKVYIHGLKEACKGKCSDSLNFTCSDQIHKQMITKYCT